MIIKSKGHKNKSGIFRFLVNYVFSDKERANEDNSFSYFHNVSSFNPEEISQEFLENDTFRKKRSNGLALHHLIMSFSPLDSEYITHEVLHDLVTKLIELRGIEGMYFGRLHASEDHIHVHLLMSANKYRNSDSMRMSKQEFDRLQKDIEAYQIEKYPEIFYSVVKREREIEFPDIGR